MIIGVVIQYTFSSLIFNEDVLAALENEENFQVGLIAASIVVFLFIIFFILYANTFFMNQRKKEFDYAVQLDGSTKNFPNDIAFESQDEHIQHCMCRLMMAFATEKSENFDYSRYIKG